MEGDAIGITTHSIADCPDLPSSLDRYAAVCQLAGRWAEPTRCRCYGCEQGSRVHLVRLMEGV